VKDLLFIFVFWYLLLCLRILKWILLRRLLNFRKSRSRRCTTISSMSSEDSKRTSNVSPTVHQTLTVDLLQSRLSKNEAIKRYSIDKKSWYTQCINVMFVSVRMFNSHQHYKLRWSLNLLKTSTDISNEKGQLIPDFTILPELSYSKCVHSSIWPKCHVSLWCREIGHLKLIDCRKSLLVPIFSCWHLLFSVSFHCKLFKVYPLLSVYYWWLSGVHEDVVCKWRWASELGVPGDGIWRYAYKLITSCRAWFWLVCIESENVGHEVYNCVCWYWKQHTLMVNSKTLHETTIFVNLIFSLLNLMVLTLLSFCHSVD